MRKCFLSSLLSIVLGFACAGLLAAFGVVFVVAM